MDIDLSKITEILTEGTIEEYGVSNWARKFGQAPQHGSNPQAQATQDKINQLLSNQQFLYLCRLLNMDPQKAANGIAKGRSLEKSILNLWSTKNSNWKRLRALFDKLEGKINITTMTGTDKYRSLLAMPHAMKAKIVNSLVTAATTQQHDMSAPPAANKTQPRTAGSSFSTPNAPAAPRFESRKKDIEILAESLDIVYERPGWHNA